MISMSDRFHSMDLCEGMKAGVPAANDSKGGFILADWGGWQLKDNEKADELREMKSRGVVVRTKSFGRNSAQLSTLSSACI